VTLNFDSQNSLISASVPWFLTAEIVGGKTENRETLRLIFRVNRLQAFVLRRVSAFARRIDDQKYIAFVFLSFTSLPSMSFILKSRTDLFFAVTEAGELTK
jgi:hypothetical protein